jgi:predicted Ser/Thr protein kinase
MTLDENIKVNYDSRFSELDSRIFNSIGISPNTARKYDDRFTPTDILHLFQMGIRPTVANLYSKSYSGKQVVRKCAEKKAREFSEPFKRPQETPIDIRTLDDFEDISEDEIDFTLPKKMPEYRLGHDDPFWDPSEEDWEEWENRYDAQEENDNPYIQLNLLDDADTVQSDGNYDWYDDFPYIDEFVRNPPRVNVEIYNEETGEVEDPEQTRYVIVNGEVQIYDSRFSDIEIEKLKDYRVPPEYIEKLNSELTCEQILELRDHSITPRMCVNYGQRFLKPGACIPLWIARVPKEYVDFVKKDVHPIAIAEAFRERLAPETLNEYSSITHIKKDGSFAKGLMALIKAEEDPSELARYSKRFDADDILAFVERNITYSYANSFGRTYNPNEIITIASKGITKEKAAEYPELEADVLVGVVEGSIDPSRVHDLPEEYRKSPYIFTMLKNGADKDYIHEFKSRFTADDIVSFVSKGNLPEEANAFPDVVDGKQVLEYLSHGMNGQDVAKYDLKRFSLEEVLAFHSRSLEGKYVEQYDPRFKGKDIVSLSGLKMKYEDANKLEPRIHGDVLESIFSYGLESKLAEFNRTLVSLLNDISRLPKGTFSVQNPRAIGMGKKSIIFQEQERALKFAYNIKHEYFLLKMISDANSNQQANVVKLYGEIIEDLGMSMEFVHGKTLADIISDGSRIQIPLLKDYMLQMINGITEMRKAGVSHTDLHLGNIMVEDKTGRLVIIDLGEATLFKDKINPHNRRFGGNNDLISIAQLAYKLASGSNLFRGIDELTVHTMAKENVYEQRAKAYEDTKLLGRYLKRIRRDIPGNFGRIIADVFNDDLYRQPSDQKIAGFMKRIEDMDKPIVIQPEPKVEPAKVSPKVEEPKLYVAPVVKKPEAPKQAEDSEHAKDKHPYGRIFTSGTGYIGKSSMYVGPSGESVSERIAKMIEEGVIQVPEKEKPKKKVQKTYTRPKKDSQLLPKNQISRKIRKGRWSDGKNLF